MTKNEYLIYIIRTLILEYRLSYDSVDELFNIDSRNICNDIIHTNSGNTSKALDYILNHETIGALVDQKRAKTEASKILEELRKCKTTKEQVEILNNLNSNTKVNQIKKKKTDDLTSDEKNTIIKYRYKYCLSMTETCNLFNITRLTLRKWENKLEDQLFIQKLTALNDYHNSFFVNNSKIR